MTNEIGLREARAELGNLANRAYLIGEINYLTRNGERIAAIVPLDRIKETAVTATDITVTLNRPADDSGWNWAEVATDQWITAAEKAGLAVELVSEEVQHVDSEAAIVSINDTKYVLDVHGDEVRAIPADEA